MITEELFRIKLIAELKTLFPGILVLRNDPLYIQGFPDLTLLFNKHWAALECKRSKESAVQPNQRFYVNMLDSLSFARIIYPENKTEVLHGLQKTFGL